MSLKSYASNPRCRSPSAGDATSDDFVPAHRNFLATKHITVPRYGLIPCAFFYSYFTTISTISSSSIS